MLLGTEKIKYFVVVDDTPTRKPNLPAGQSEGNRDRPQCNQDDRPPAAARKYNISDLAKFQRKAPSEASFSTYNKHELQTTMRIHRAC
jgi:hypothetical protein